MLGSTRDIEWRYAICDEKICGRGKGGSGEPPLEVGIQFSVQAEFGKQIPCGNDNKKNIRKADSLRE
jgi:hypothetical protein